MKGLSFRRVKIFGFVCGIAALAEYSSMRSFATLSSRTKTKPSYQLPVFCIDAQGS